jgi:hypothetical protein
LAVLNCITDRKRPLWDPDLDLLLRTVHVTADDLLPEPQNNAARRITDAEFVTLCVAQAVMGIPSDRRFLAIAGKRVRHLFAQLPKQPGYSHYGATASDPPGPLCKA